MNSGFFSELVKKAIKYLCEGLIIGSKLRDLKKLDMEEVIIIGLSAAATFAVLDVFSPASVPVQEEAWASP
jgi:hypothetical protein